MTDLYLLFACLGDDLRSIARKHTKLLRKRYGADKLTNSILNLIDSKEPVTELDIKTLLSIYPLGEDLNKIAMDYYHKGNELTEITKLAIIEKLKSLVSYELLSESNNSTNSTKIVEELRNYEFDFNKETDVDTLVRYDVDLDKVDIDSIVQSLGDPIRSSIDEINRSFNIGGYIRNQLIGVVAPPGCFTGDTKVITLDNGPVTMEDLYLSRKMNIKVVSGDDNRFRGSIGDHVELTKYVTELCILILSDGSVIKCTTDHKIMKVDGSYVEASELKVNDELMSLYTKIHVTNVTVMNVPRTPVYDLINVENYHNFAIETSNGNGIIVHNCGKSLFCMQESARFLCDGYKVLYVAVGDLDQKDFVTRLSSMICNIPMDETNTNTREAWNRMNNTVGEKLKNFKLLGFDPGTITIDQLGKYFEEVDKSKGKENYFEKYDIVVLDYDTNFLSSNDMYAKGEEIYNKAAAWSKIFKLVFIVSQPKTAYYDCEIIPQAGLAESSRKPQILDVIISIGKHPTSVNNIGFINIAKIRRGGAKRHFRYHRDVNGIFNAVSETAYNVLKNSVDIVTQIGAGPQLNDEEMNRLKDAIKSDGKELKT